MAKLSDIINNEKEAKKTPDDVATRLMELEESSVKDKQVTIRINSGLYRKYEKVCKKLGFKPKSQHKCQAESRLSRLFEYFCILF